jgi:peroxiredoxin
MKLLLFALVLGTAAFGAPVEKLTDFELADQNLKTRIYRFPKSKVTVMTVADHKGSGELAPWIQRLHDRYQKKIDIDGVADVSMIPKPFHNMFREAFRKQLTYSVMLDWEGSVVKQFGYTKRAANIYVIDRRGRIVKQVVGPVSDNAMRQLTTEIDGAIAGEPLK